MRDGTADGAARRAGGHRAGLQFREYAGDGRVPAGAVVLLRAVRRRVAVVVGFGAAAALGDRVRVSTGGKVDRGEARLAGNAGHAPPRSPPSRGGGMTEAAPAGRCEYRLV